MEDESFSIEALIFILILVIYILASYFINKLQISFLHQSTVAIFLGFLTALFLKLIMEKQIAFSNEVFFSLLVPPIVFSVGYGMKKPEFFQNFLSISFLGIFSTIFSICIQTFFLTLISGSLIADLSEKEMMLLAIILSSSDPIATLPVLKSNTDRLNAIITGESVLNCSIVIILFGTVQKLSNSENTLELETIIQILGSFAYLFIFSLLLGMFFGFGLSYLFKRFLSFSEYHIKQTSLILLTGYIVYLSGQFVGLSGIIALFTTSVVFSQYGFKNLSHESQHGTILAFESIRYIFQAFIFTYLGASLLITQNKWNAFGAAVILISFNPIIRLTMIYLLSLILKLLKKSFPLSKAETKLLWYSGIVRGIIAFALSLQIQSANQAYVHTTTLLVVMCTTIFSATFFNKFCEIIGFGEVELLKVGHFKDEERQIQLLPSTKYGIIGSEQKEIVMVANQQKFKSFEQKYLRPFFTRQDIEVKQQNTPNLMY